MHTAIKLGYGGLKEETATEEQKNMIRDNCLKGVYN